MVQDGPRISPRNNVIVNKWSKAIMDALGGSPRNP